MKIKRFAYTNKALGWELKSVEFDDLTLLVGLSGAGKTRILDALLDVKAIADGTAKEGVSWDIEFTTNQKGHYHWRGKYDRVDPEFALEDDDSRTRSKPRIISENLSRDDSEIVVRTATEILLLGEATPRLSPYASVLSILSEVDEVGPPSTAFQRILRSSQPSPGLAVPVPASFATKCDTLEKIQESSHHTQVKLGLAYRSQPAVFARIRDRFVEIFPNTTDVRAKPKAGADASLFLPTIQIKERGVANWIDQGSISSGMLRTLLHISEMYLWPQGTVILIDEFENSLGINCIDVLTDELLERKRDLQFIVTSHHPYIINNIAPRYWKVVRREGGQVSALAASSLGLGESRHEAFIQLINHDEYREGIKAA